MRPLRSFLILLIILAVLAGLHFVFPLSRFFPAAGDYLPSELTRTVFRGQPSLNVAGPEVAPNIPSTASRADTAVIADHSSDTSGTHAGDTSLPSKRNSGPLGSFLDSLSLSGGQVRIMYYGDSQIEGDRITSFLRTSLRKGRGGSGPGLLMPVMPVMYTKTVSMRSSSNWKKYNYLSYRAGTISHRRLGPFMAVCRFLPEGKRTRTPERATVKIEPSYLADSSASRYDRLRIFYGNAAEPVMITVKGDGKVISTDTLQRGRGFFEFACSLNSPGNLVLEFEGNVSPDIYGISIESSSGVVVDNIPQRGSAGLEFTMVDSVNLAEVFSRLKPDLIVLHYGLNIVKNVRHDYSYFKRGLRRQLRLLSDVAPYTPVLVMSLSDMAESVGDTIRSYPNIPAIIRAQREAAGNEGAGFWNTFRSMGGDSSIIRWAGMTPPLAQKDYVHFTYPGADTLSRILTDALFTVQVSEDTAATRSEAHVLDTLVALPQQPPLIKPVEAVEDASLTGMISGIFRYDPQRPLIFSTAAFWIFFLFVLAGYTLIYRKPVMRNGYLFLVSLFFYYKSGGLFLFLLILVTTIDFTCGLLIYNSGRQIVKRIIIVISVVSNLGILAYFKYTGLIVSTLNDLLGTRIVVTDVLAEFSNSLLGTSFSIGSIMLPVGVSFFTFQSLSYTIDVYRGKMTPVRNLVDFGFYVSFFPQLVAGPIVRASEFIPQIYREFHLNKREFSHAMFLIAKGLIKKIIISDFIAVAFIDRVFDAPAAYSGFENLMAVYGYGLQIYCDFSGYTDIAIGLGLILGFRLPVNFNSPYKASDLSDFWKRWHISLSRWLKDYLYITLGGNRKGRFRTYLNILITMLLGGLWHGAALRFLVWGLLHGIGVVLVRIWNSLTGGRLRKFRVYRAAGVFLTFNFVSFCWIFFRAPDLGSAGVMLKQIAGNFSPGSYEALLSVYSSAFLLTAVGYVIHFLPESVKESYRGVFIRIPVAAQVIIMVLVGLLLYQMSTTDVVPFIYFRF